MSLIKLAPLPERPQKKPTVSVLVDMREAVRDFVFHASRCEDDHDRDYCLSMAEGICRKIERLTGKPEPMPPMEQRYAGVHLHAGGKWYWELLTNNSSTRIRRSGFACARDAAQARESYFDRNGITGVMRNKI